MAYSPVTQGEVVTLRVRWLNDDGSPLILPNDPGALSLVFAPDTGEASTNQRFVGSGEFQITDASKGDTSYTTSAEDTANAGRWRLQGVAELANGPRYSDPVEFWIREPL